MVMESTTAKGVESSDWSRLGLAIAGTAPLPMILVEGAGHVVRYVNPAFCRLMSTPDAELLGKTFGEMLRDKPACVAALDRISQTGKPEKHAELQADHTHPVFWSYTMWPVQTDTRPGGIAIQVTEITQLHE